MARRSRTEFNRAALSEIEGGLADGVFEIAREIAYNASTRAPDAPPYGEGLVDRGGAATWVRGKKVRESTTGPAGKVDKPSSLRLKSAGAEIVGAVGFGFPGMFVELGTVKMAAEPFLTPAAGEVVGDRAQLIMSKAMARRLRGERSEKTAQIRAAIAASRAAKAAATA